jgi:hypothetical protein
MTDEGFCSGRRDDGPGAKRALGDRDSYLSMKQRRDARKSSGVTCRWMARAARERKW